ncbi:lactococcin 972 family bacteriocin [Streptomyces olivaceoviridis]
MLDEGANTAWSNVKHPTNQHASSVKIGSQAFKSGCTTRGEWPLASGTKTAAASRAATTRAADPPN